MYLRGTRTRTRTKKERGKPPNVNHSILESRGNEAGDTCVNATYGPNDIAHGPEVAPSIRARLVSLSSGFSPSSAGRLPAVGGAGLLAGFRRTKDERSVACSLAASSCAF